MTDTPVVLGSDGYPLRYGRVYRFVAIVPESTMALWNIGGPTQENLRAAALRVGWSPDQTRFHWPDEPALSDWPSLPTMDDYVIRGEGMWASANKLPVQTPLADFGSWMGWIRVWEHTETAAPGATPPSFNPTTPGTAPKTQAGSPPTTDPRGPPARRKRKPRVPIVPLLVVGGLLGGVWFLATRNQRASANEEKGEAP